MLTSAGALAWLCGVALSYHPDAASWRGLTQTLGRMARTCESSWHREQLLGGDVGVCYDFCFEFAASTIMRWCDEHKDGVGAAAGKLCELA